MLVFWRVIPVSNETWFWPPVWFSIAVKVAFPHQGLMRSLLGNEFVKNTESSMAFFGGPLLFGGETDMGVQKISSPFKIWASIGNWYIYLEPYVWPLFLKVNPWKQGLFTPSKTRGPHQRVPGNTIIKWILEGGPLPFISTSRFITPLSGVIISPQENQLFFSHL